MSGSPASLKGEQTRKMILQAIRRMEHNCPKVVEEGRKLTIASVAEEAGISRASIHNNYPDLAEQIRAFGNKAVRRQRNEKHEALQQEKEKNRNLRAELTGMRAKLQDLASKNASLTYELEELKAIVKSNKVTVINTR